MIGAVFLEEEKVASVLTFFATLRRNLIGSTENQEMIHIVRPAASAYCEATFVGNVLQPHH